jgi:YD repeat-containing protein
VYFELDSGALSRLTVIDPQTRTSGSFQIAGEAFTTGTISTGSATYEYAWDPSGRLIEIADAVSGARVEIGYLPDRVEYRSYDGDGTNTLVQVVFQSGDRVMTGAAPPGVPYALGDLTDVMDVTSAVDSALGRFGAAPAAGEVTVHAQALAGNLFDAAVTFAVAAAGSVTVSGIVGVVGIAVTGACIFTPGCAPLAVGAAALLGTLLVAEQSANAAEVVPASFAGTYASTRVLPDGFTHTETDTVVGLTASGHHTFHKDGASGSFTWTATIVPDPSAPGRGSLVGTVTIDNLGVRVVRISSGSIEVSGAAGQISWGAIDPTFGGIGWTTYRQ